MTEDAAPPGASARARRRSPGQIAWSDIRAAYEGSDLPLPLISAAFGVAVADLYPRAEREGWMLRRDRRVLERKARRRTKLPDKVEPAVLIARMLAAVARQIEDIEARVGGGAAETGDRDARTLASLARTLDLLIGLDRGAATSDSEARPDIDDLRRDLARRIENLRGS